MLLWQINRKNRNWLKERNIRIVGKPLGRPKKEKLSPYQKRKKKKEQNMRNHIEAKFGTGKTSYGLDDTKAKRQDTSESWIAAIFFVMNIVEAGKKMLPLLFLPINFCYQFFAK